MTVLKAFELVPFRICHVNPPIQDLIRGLRETIVVRNRVLIGLGDPMLTGRTCFTCVILQINPTDLQIAKRDTWLSSRTSAKIYD